MVCELLEWGGKCIGFPSILMEYANLRKKSGNDKSSEWKRLLVGLLEQVATKWRFLHEFCT